MQWIFSITLCWNITYFVVPEVIEVIEAALVSCEWSQCMYIMGEPLVQTVSNDWWYLLIEVPYLNLWLQICRVFYTYSKRWSSLEKIFNELKS